MTAGDPMVREYRRRADECRAQVEKTKGENEKGKWLNLAAKWTTLPRTQSAGERIEGCLGRTEKPACIRRRPHDDGSAERDPNQRDLTARNGAK